MKRKTHKTHKTHSPRAKTNSRALQRSDTEAAFHPEQGDLNEAETRALLDITQGFRYGELMEPVRTELMSLALQEPALSGWVIRLDLSLAEFELMRGVHLPPMEISFEQHRSGHSALILSTAVDPLQICLAIPLWESGMRRWLEYVAETRQITLLLLSVEDGKYGMTGVQDFNQEDVAEWRKMAKSLQPYRGPLKDHEAMAHLGMEVMTGRAGHLDLQEALQADMRTLVVAQRDNAMKVMNIYSQLAMELKEELAMASQGNPH